MVNVSPAMVIEPVSAVVLEAKPWPDRQFESQEWKVRALRLRDASK
jgi:hypothetical protein